MDGARRASRVMMRRGEEKARKSKNARFKAKQAVLKGKRLAEEEAR